MLILIGGVYCSPIQSYIPLKAQVEVHGWSVECFGGSFRSFRSHNCLHRPPKFHKHFLLPNHTDMWLPQASCASIEAIFFCVMFAFGVRRSRSLSFCANSTDLRRPGCFGLLEVARTNWMKYCMQLSPSVIFDVPETGYTNSAHAL